MTGEHCYAHQGCNGPGYCGCACPDCTAPEPRYESLWCGKHPGKRHVHRGFPTEVQDVTTWRCIDA